MKEIWDKRYSGIEYVYGIDPNSFFKEQLEGKSPKRILLSAEGEGRNAVYAATCGWEVSAFDTSEKAMEKAMRLAKTRGVNINYHISSVMDIDFITKDYDCVASFFMHLPKNIKFEAYAQIISKLKPGGLFIFEAFSDEQLKYSSGGPKDLEMLFTVKDIETIFKDFSEVKINKSEQVLDEGPFHQGLASTIQVQGIK